MEGTVAGHDGAFFVPLLEKTYYDIAVRDVALLFAAVALARLAERYHGKRQH